MNSFKVYMYLRYHGICAGDIMYWETFVTFVPSHHVRIGTLEGVRAPKLTGCTTLQPVLYA